MQFSLMIDCSNCIISRLNPSHNLCADYVKAEIAQHNRFRNHGPCRREKTTNR